MSTRVEICNRALAKLGNYAIVSLEDPSDVAVALKGMYGVLLDGELAANRWGFALARAVLPALEEAPAFGYARAFQLPADCLRVLEVGATWPVVGAADCRFGPGAAWEIEDGKILTNAPAPLPLRYIRRVEDPARYPAGFVDALACRLAVELCERLSGGASRREMLWKEYDQAVRTAQRVSAIQRAPEYLQDGAWMLTRSRAGGGA